jgi:excisionase family DNA binding protein
MRADLDTEVMLTVPEVARRLRLEEHFVYILIQRGLLTAVQIGGYKRGAIRIRPSALNQAMRQWETRGGR